jgi:hypothetical protein
MTSLVSPPCFNDRLAIVFGQTKAIDKSLKFASNLTSFSSDIFREIGSSSVACKGLDALAESFYSIRNGVKIFDTFQDLSQPSGDIHEVRMKWIQLLCFTVADVVNPILYFESNGFYTIGNELKKSMIAYSAKISLFGLATNLIHSFYQFFTSLKIKNSVEIFFQEEDVEQEIERLNEQKTAIFNKIERLRKCYKDLDESIAKIKFGADLAKQVDDIVDENNDILNLNQQPSFSSTQTKIKLSNTSEDIHTHFKTTEKNLSISKAKALKKIQELEQKIDAFEEKLSTLEGYKVGQACLNKHFYQTQLSLVENILEIASIIISLAGVSTIAVPATLIIALLGVLSSAMAMIKIWHQSAQIENEEQKYQELLNCVSQVTQNLNQL